MLKIATFAALFDWEETVTLDGVDFGLRVRWNDRARAWFCDIATSDGTVLMRGERLRPGDSLFRQLRDRRAPAGLLFAVQIPGGETDDPAELGRRLQLLYVEAGELATAEAEAARALTVELL